MTTTTPAPGEKDLSTLLSTLTTSLHPSTFVFITLPNDPASAESPSPPRNMPIQMSFKEAEGLTLITTLAAASQNNLEYVFPSRMMTLEVKSSLEAVGFMAEVTRKLTERGIGCNPMSGFWHDHLFVPIGREEEAMLALRELAGDAKKKMQR